MKKTRKTGSHSREALIPGYYGSGAGDFGGNQCAGRFPAFVSYEI